jgi:cytochrome P450
MPGSGLQPGHTTGRGILDDATILVRGDRFLSHDLNTSTLTHWGVSQLAPVPGAYGGFLGHILFRGLPNSWGHGLSTYCLLPFYTPKAVREILKKNKVLDKYETDRPESAVKLHGLHSYQACKDAFLDRDTFRTIYDDNLQYLTAKAGFMIGWDDHSRHDDPASYMREAFFEPCFEANVRDFFRDWTRKMIDENSLGYDHPQGKKQLNVVRDVFNRVPIYWIADKYAIPLKTKATPLGLISPFELHAMLVALFIFSSFDVIPSNAWVLRSAAEEFGPLVRKILETRLKMSMSLAEKVTDWLSRGTAFEMSAGAQRLYDTLHKKKVPMDKAIGSLLGTMLPIAGNLTQQTALLLDLFLTPGYEYAKDRMIELAAHNDQESESEMEMWVWEGLRLRGIVPGLPRMAAQDVVVQDGPDRIVDIKAGERLVIGIAKAHMDPNVFPNPEVMDPTRDKKLYMLLGVGIHFCFGARLIAPSIVSMLREVFLLKNIRRAQGQAGTFIKVHQDLGHDFDAARVYLYLDSACREGPVPSSMVIEYDE